MVCHTNVLYAIRMADKACRNVIETPRDNYFKTGGFLMAQEKTPLKTLDLDMNLEAEQNKLQNVDVQFEDYVGCDAELANTNTKIINLVNQNVENDDADDEYLSEGEID